LLSLLRATMLHRLHALEVFGIKLGLANITALCEALGHPERAFAVLHIAGTNGKGSVTAMAHAALVAAGLRAARYTSPHLVHLNERFVIGTSPVSDANLESAAGHVLDVADRLVADGALSSPPTFFEATTAIAFELFERAGVEVAVLEVGLGGRFDATNVVTPVAGAITTIGLDHQAQLGDTLASIAFEKAGIIKRGMDVVIGDLPREAHDVIQRVAIDSEARVVHAREDVRVMTSIREGRATIELQTPMHDYGTVPLALRGEHQVENAIVAARLLEVARERGIPVSFDAIAHGLARAEWPARLERLHLDDGRSVLIDAAHNPDGARALASYLEHWHPDRPPLVFAAMRDKDVDGVLRVLLPVTRTIVVTAPATPRAETPEALAERIRALDPNREVIVEPEPAKAVARALTGAPLVCVAGSIFLAGAVREALRGRAILP
jgi:dihydrofolate synthase / folylpolyglutamate synthase